MFHKIKCVSYYSDLKICATFNDGTTKLYNVEPLINKWIEFEAFNYDPSLIKLAHVAPGGYGIIWNDEIDLSCDEIWANGTVIHTEFDNFLAFSDACELWGLSESALRKAVARGKVKAGIDT